MSDETDRRVVRRRSEDYPLHESAYSDELYTAVSMVQSAHGYLSLIDKPIMRGEDEVIVRISLKCLKAAVENLNVIYANVYEKGEIR